MIGDVRNQSISGYCIDLDVQEYPSFTFRWHHNGHDGVSNHQPHHCLLNRLFWCRSKKTSKLRLTGLCAGPVNSPHKWPVTRKMFPFDDVIMSTRWVKHFINRCLFFSYELLKNMIVGMWIHIIFPFSSCIFVVTSYLWIDSNRNIACNEMSHFVLAIAPCKYYARITRHEYDIR